MISKTSNTGLPTTKVCTRCLVLKPLSDYRKYSGRSRYGLRPLCADCQRAYEAAWRNQNRARLTERRRLRAEKEKAYRQVYDTLNRAKLLAREARRRSAKGGLPYDLDEHLAELEARMQAGVCEMTGTPFSFDLMKPNWNSPSLDRIVPSLGYVYSNIRVVCFAMNAALGSWGEGPLAEVMTRWLKRRS